MGIFVGISFFVLLTIGCSQGALNELISVPHEFKDPPVHDGPVVVALGIYIVGILEINEKRMDYTFMMYYRESWKDTRVSPSKGSIMVHRNDLKKFWFPDIFLRNEKFAATHNVMTENRLLKISHDGKLWHVRKISVTLACPMNFMTFPFDTQSCSISFESFAYTMDTLVLSWLEGPVQVEPSLSLPKYTLTNYHLYDCSQNYTTVVRNKTREKQADASSYGLSACLLQRDGPVAYGSRSLTDREKNYAQIEKELVAIVFACSKFDGYIYGQVVTVHSDHRPLEPVFKKSIHDMSPRLQGLLLKLLRYNLIVKYVPGKELHIPYTLSKALALMRLVTQSLKQK